MNIHYIFDPDMWLFIWLGWYLMPFLSDIVWTCLKSMVLACYSIARYSQYTCFQTVRFTAVTLADGLWRFEPLVVPQPTRETKPGSLLFWYVDICCDCGLQYGRIILHHCIYYCINVQQYHSTVDVPCVHHYHHYTRLYKGPMAMEAFGRPLASAPLLGLVGRPTGSSATGLEGQHRTV